MSEAVPAVDAVAAEKQRKFRIQAAAFMGLVGGISALFGFSRTLATAKKSDSKVLQQQGTRQGIILMDEGATLAMRALGWGTLYAVLGTGTFFYGFWKLSGAKDFEEFRMKMGNALPRITKDEPPQSSTDFESLTDLMKYLAAWNKE
ncbi:transmembrane protein 242 isoform X2 [Drosophila grimshawi]|uniref:Transmembrane protein 242 n=1 Tax=Drosophila grimshawi TaxID=7222 RepID=B4JXA7_DROGR|nr:transmembrane protein 242 isoform X2 [Drosophila grimshawi]EDV95383.1 GH17914 [Drosophila grimshawi]